MVSHSTVARLNLPAIIAVGALSAAAVAPTAAAVADSPELQEIVVTATLRSMPATEVPASVTVLSEQTLRDAGRANLEDVLGLIPNLNWAGDTSLPRYFQLRGIGELEQYQGAPNPSVGFLIDDIDFSGLGTAGTLYDIDQVDVMRGPQPTRYGANALGGLIYLKSAEPTDALYGRVDLDAGDYATNSQGAVISGPVESLDSGFRLAVQRYYSNGYYHDLYLNRDDTNRQDEYTYRAKWAYTPSDRLRIELTAMHMNIDGRLRPRSLPRERHSRAHRDCDVCQVGHQVQLRRRLGESCAVGARGHRLSGLGDSESRPHDQNARAAPRHRIDPGIRLAGRFLRKCARRKSHRFELERLPAPRPSRGPRR
jgi:outer membrane receptor protein involved in Fe transport